MYIYTFGGARSPLSRLPLLSTSPCIYYTNMCGANMCGAIFSELSLTVEKKRTKRYVSLCDLLICDLLFF